MGINKTRQGPSSSKDHPIYLVPCPTTLDPIFLAFFTHDPFHITMTTTANQSNKMTDTSTIAQYQGGIRAVHFDDLDSVISEEEPIYASAGTQTSSLCSEGITRTNSFISLGSTVIESLYPATAPNEYRGFMMSNSFLTDGGESLEEFKGLSSTKQNVELFKILSAIASEIENLRMSTEKRFLALEQVVQRQQGSSSVTTVGGSSSRSSGANGIPHQWDRIKANRAYNQYKNMAGPMVKQRRDSKASKADSSLINQELAEEAESSLGSLGDQRSPSWPRLTELEYLREKKRADEQLVILNVGGVRFEATWSLLERLPQTRLGKLRKCQTDQEVLELCAGFNPETNEYKFDRQPRNFPCVLNFLNTGKLHLGEETCVIAFSQDMEYWGVDDLYLEPCCVQRYYQQRELLNWDHQIKKEEENEYFRPGRVGKFQKILWDLFEKPHTSLGARIVAIISITFIIISTVVLTLNTLPYFSARSQEDHEKDYPPFALLEAVYMSWFTFEFVIRLLSCPSKVKFMKSIMNVIDLLAILPYYVSIALVNSTDIGQLTEVRRIAQFFRIMRILRIFKLARHSVGLQSLGFTLRNSYKELGLLMLFIIMGVLIFSSLAYVFEKDDRQTKFTTMMDSYWWALITMTTVGYGDISPVTGFGKVIGSCCAICGVLVIALPIPIIGNNFAAFYKNERRREQLAEKKLAIERARRKGAIQPFPGQTSLPLEENMGLELDVTELDTGRMTIWKLGFAQVG